MRHRNLKRGPYAGHLQVEPHAGVRSSCGPRRLFGQVRQMYETDTGARPRSEVAREVEACVADVRPGRVRDVPGDACPAPGRENRLDRQRAEVSRGSVLDDWPVDRLRSVVVGDREVQNVDGESLNGGG